MNRTKSEKLLTISLIILSIIGLLAVFLSWVNIQYTAAAEGSPAMQDVNRISSFKGYQLWSGPVVIFLFLAQLFFAFVRDRKLSVYGFIPSSIAVVSIAVFMLIFNERSAGNLMGSTNDLTEYIHITYTYGIFLSLLSSILSVFTIYLRLNELGEEDELSAGSVPGMQPAATEYQPGGYSNAYNRTDGVAGDRSSGFSTGSGLGQQSKSLTVAEAEEIIALSGRRRTVVSFSVIIVVLLGVAATLFIHFYGGKSPAPPSLSKEAEQNRLDSLKKHIEMLIDGHNYDEASAELNDFQWRFNPADFPEEVQLYNKEREKFNSTIRDLKKENSSNTIDDEYTTGMIRDSLFGAEAVSDRAYFFSQPNESARTDRYCERGEVVSVSKTYGVWWYATFYSSRVTSGWINKRDYRKIPNTDGMTLAVAPPHDDYDEHEYSDDGEFRKPTTRQPDNYYGDEEEESPPPKAVELGKKYVHSAKKSSIEFSSNGTLKFYDGVGSTPYPGTWSKIGDNVYISVPTYHNSSWNLILKSDGLYNKSGGREWVLSY